MTAQNRFVRRINSAIRSNHSGQQDFPSISIFSGILGIELGLERAGFRTALALDFDKDAKEVVESNRARIGEFPYLCQDINKLSARDILKDSGLKPGDAAIIAGGPPCQPFSKSGLRQGVNDERGGLFKHYLEYLEVIRPQAFLLENVRGLFSSRGGKDFKLILDLFDQTGYTVYWKVLDAANYGVPQFRQRLFFVGFRDRLRFSFPEETHGDLSELVGTLFPDQVPFVTVEDAIGDMVGKVVGPAHTGRYATLLKEIPEGMNYSFFTEKRGHANPLFGWRTKFWYFLLKIDRRKPSLTIQAYPGNNTGPFHWENRRLATEELLRLQTFPDWYKLKKPYLAAHRLIGNAVPPLLAETIGRSIKETLVRQEGISKLEYTAIRINTENTAGYVNSGRGSGRGKKIFEAA